MESQFLENAAEGALGNEIGLGAGDGLEQRRGAADKDVHVVVGGLEQVLLEVLLRDVSGLAIPASTGLVNKEMELELVGVLSLDFFQFALEQNVLFGLGAVEQVDLGVVLGVPGNAVDQLVERRDAGATSNEGNLLVLVGGPRVLGEGSHEGDGLVEAKVEDVVTKLAVGVSLDDQTEATGLIEVGDRRVRSNDRGAFSVHELGKDGRSQGQSQLLVIRDFKGELLSLKGEGESEHVRYKRKQITHILGESLDVNELEVDKAAEALETLVLVGALGLVVPVVGGSDGSACSYNHASEERLLSDWAGSGRKKAQLALWTVSVFINEREKESRGNWGVLTGPERATDVLREERAELGRLMVVQSVCVCV